MKRLLCFLLLSGVVLPVGQVKSQEPLDVQIEFIRRLRAKGYNDLALEHIDKLRSNLAPSAPLQLERARTMLALARAKEPEQRPPLFAAARAELETFVQKNSSGPEGAQGRLEIARLAAYEGQAQLTRALREEDTAIAKQAEQQFIKAGQELDAAAKVLAEAGAAMTTQAMIEEMAAKGYWSSPGGQTPAATLYSAILRELSTKGDQARFVKTERGKFGLRSPH